MSATRCRYEKKPGIILDHLEGVLAEREDEVFRAHLAGCARCAGELRTYAEILALARHEPAPVAAPGAETRIRTGMRARLAERGVGGRRRFGRGPFGRARAPGWTWWRAAWAGGVAVAALVLVILWAGERERDHDRGDHAHVTAAPDTLETGALHETAPAPEPMPTRAEVAEAEDRLEENGFAGSQLAEELDAYEYALMAEYGDDLALDDMAFELLDPDAEEAFTRLVNQELEALLAKYGSPQEQS